MIRDLLCRLLPRWRSSRPRRAVTFRPTLESLEDTVLPSATRLRPPDHVVERRRLSADPSDRVILRQPGFDYVPSVMFDRGKYRMWWCAQGPGGKDNIWYAETDRLRGRWSTPRSVFAPRPGSGFDRRHTCDPSVIRVGGTYYLYYGGLAHDNPRRSPAATMIGVARSRDGIHWKALNGGRPIVMPHRPVDQAASPYGAGQPSVVHVNGFFCMLFTDTTGAQSNPATGGGLYVVRSPGPTFQTGVEELSLSTPGAFVPRANSPANYGNLATDHPLLEGVSSDWLYSAELNAFVVARVYDRSEADGTLTPILGLDVFDASTWVLRGSTAIAGVTWSEGPGLVRTAAGHLPPAQFRSDGLGLEVVRSVGERIPAGATARRRARAVATWDLAAVQVVLPWSAIQG